MAIRPGPKAQNVLADQIILFIGSLTDCPYRLRRLVVWAEKNQKQVVLLTNHHHKLAAAIVANIYKAAGRSSCSSRRLSKTLKSTPLWTLAATLWESRFGQP
ncbi:hypothetical protein DFAR_2950014 [Desulfarculales bacterium]